MLFPKKTKRKKNKEIREKETRSWATKCKTLLKMRHFRSTHATTAATAGKGLKRGAKK